MSSINSDFIRLYRDILKPKNKAHGIVLSIAVFYGFVFFALDTTRPDFFNQETRVLLLIIGGFIGATLSWFSFSRFLENDDNKSKLVGQNQEEDLFKDQPF
ncbi:hypothetical protein [Rhabdochromatium marinum]|uniref:hypothetical protein n=1 Tax=Rhabdochromatium marinum TaxID=48729 RepID=UPI0019085470|nr:hypothetical protein [Rhabdochromatium marinum]MBK1647413.1 hypothetical protein [Rhabdochromatium marinum]